MTGSSAGAGLTMGFSAGAVSTMGFSTGAGSTMGFSAGVGSLMGPTLIGVRSAAERPLSIFSTSSSSSALVNPIISP